MPPIALVCIEFECEANDVEGNPVNARYTIENLSREEELGRQQVQDSLMFQQKVAAHRSTGACGSVAVDEIAMVLVMNRTGRDVSCCRDDPVTASVGWMNS